MDYKFRQNTILAAIMVILMVISVVVIANWQTISRSHKNSGSKETNVSAAEENASEALAVAGEKGNFTGTRIGNDLYAWMSDELFFDSATRKNGKTIEKEPVLTKRDLSGNDLSGNDLSGNDLSGNDISENDENGRPEEEKPAPREDDKNGKDNSRDL